MLLKETFCYFILRTLFQSYLTLDIQINSDRKSWEAFFVPRDGCLVSVLLLTDPIQALVYLDLPFSSASDLRSDFTDSRATAREWLRSGLGLFPAQLLKGHLSPPKEARTRGRLQGDAIYRQP